VALLSTADVYVLSRILIVFLIRILMRMLMIRVFLIRKVLIRIFLIRKELATMRMLTL